MFTNYGLETIILLAFCFVFLAPIFAIVYHFIKLQRWDGTGKKPAFAWWTVVAPITLCLIPVGIYSLALVSTLMGPSAYSSSTPTIRPTFTYAAPTPKVKPPTDEPTPNPCTPASLVTPAQEGKTLCVYGKLIRQQFIPHNRTVRLYLSESPPFFFLCENCYYDVNPGDCISFSGSIQLTTDDQPFINLHGGRLSSCQ